MTHIAALVSEAIGLLQESISERMAWFDARSPTWQDSDKGIDHAKHTDNLQLICADLENAKRTLIQLNESYGSIGPDFIPMSPTDFRAHRKALGLTIPRLAELLGKNERTIRRWEAGTWPIDKAVEMLMPRLVAEALTAPSDQPAPRASS